MAWYNPLSWNVSKKIDTAMAPQNRFQATAPDVDPNAYRITNKLGGDLRSGLSGAESGYNVSPAKAATVQGTSLGGPNLSGSDSWGTQQQSFAKALKARAAGQVPSAAEAQLQRGLQSALEQQQASAASARGVSAGMAQRIAAQAGERAVADTNAQAAELRAQEQAQAEQTLGGFMGTARGQELSAAELAQATNIERARLSQEASLANAGYQQQTSLANQQLTLEAQRARDSAIQNYLQLGLTREQAQQQALADEQAQTTQRLLGVQGINAGVAAGNQQASTTGRSAVLGAGASVLGSLFSAGSRGAVASDIRLKKNIRSGEEVEDDMREFLDALKAYAFDYKSEKHGGKDNYGFMAQDAEKSKLGKTLVVEIENGKKGIDGKRALMAALAGLAHMHGRLKAVEGKAA